MKTLIFQHFATPPDIPKRKKEFYAKCVSTVQRYANNIGAEYLCTTQPYFKKWHPVWGCFQVLVDDSFLQYDKVLYVDADVFAHDTDDNRIFENYGGISASCHMRNDRTRARPEYRLYGPDFFNSGVVLWDNETICKMREHKPRKYMDKYRKTVPGRDQIALNMLTKDTVGSYNNFDLDDVCYFVDNSHIHNAVLVHVAGRLRNDYHNNTTKWDQFFNVST